MARRGDIPKRKILPDPKFNNVTLAKFVNNLFRNGKKSVAETIMYSALDIIEERVKKDPIDIFKAALNNAKPQLEVKSRRVGGSTYQVPVEIRPNRREALAMRWLIDFAKKRPEKSMNERLAAEFIEAANKRGATIKKREDVHKMAEANKAFAHFRW